MIKSLGMLTGNDIKKVERYFEKQSQQKMLKI